MKIRPRSFGTVLSVILSTGLGVSVVGTGMPAAVAGTSCPDNHFITSWATSPTDSVTPVDANFGVTPTVVSDQSFRSVITPHMGGSTLKVRLSNRYGATPVTFGHVTVARQADGPDADGTPVPVEFSGSGDVTLGPGEEIVSDPVDLSFGSFDPLLVSTYVSGVAGPPTQHWNANATSYMAPPGSGDRTGDASGGAFSDASGAWLYTTGLEVGAPADAGTLVAFGDSITDGFVGSGRVPIPADASVNDSDHRYPDALQRRLDEAGSPVAVANAGIGSNQLLVNAEPLFLGAAGVDRFHRDALDLPGAYGVIVLIGINDLGLNPTVTTQAMIDGYRNLVSQARDSGKKIWLGTITPASDALVDGTLLAPQSDRMRTEINDWIRSQDIADGYVDFDAALRSPDDPSVMRADYASPDHLHPNPAGYRAMADAVDLAQIRKDPGVC